MGSKSTGPGVNDQGLLGRSVSGCQAGWEELLVPGGEAGLTLCPALCLRFVGHPTVPHCTKLASTLTILVVFFVTSSLTPVNCHEEFFKSIIEDKERCY